jgi:transaldolase
MPSKLDSLRLISVVVADTGDIEAVKRLKPQDCTTNPTLILRAVENPNSLYIIQEALDWGRSQSDARDDVIHAICDRLAVRFGAELASIVPGYISTEVDADLSFDTQLTVTKAKKIIESYKEFGIRKERILIKIAATWEGIKAAEILQKQGIHCNLTLVFNLHQAMACADAGVFLISPFVGRILDWHLKNGGGPYIGSTDPGVVSVTSIYDAFKAKGVPTIVMGASFRNVEEIEALAGCDRLTIAPGLLDQLSIDNAPIKRVLKSSQIDHSFKWQSHTESSFRLAMNEDAMATEKLAEGIRLFSRDLRLLRTRISEQL